MMFYDLSNFAKTVFSAALLIPLFGCFMASPITALATDYYVKTPAHGGNNSHSGMNWNAAKATIGAAMALADGDDTIFVAAGTYNEKISFPPCNNVALRGGYPAAGGAVQAPSENPTIIEGTGLDSPMPMIKIPFQPDTTRGYFGMIIEGFVIRGGTHTGNGCAGIESYSLGVTIKRNIIENNHTTGSSGLAGGIYVFAPLYDTGKTVIEQNMIRDNSAPAVGGVYLEGAAGKAEKYDIYLSNNLIAENVSTTTDPLWNRGVGGVDVMYPAGASIVNCTIADNSASHPNKAIPGVSIDGYSASEQGVASIANSIIWHPSGNDIASTDNGRLWIAYSCVEDQSIGGSGVIHTNPQFSETDDYHLTESSPCKNTASTQGTLLSGAIGVPSFGYLPGIGFQNPPYNYSDAMVTLSWGDGSHNLTAQWEYASSYGSGVTGKFYGSDRTHCNADVSYGQALGDNIPGTTDASGYYYRTSSSTAKWDPFTAKETVFWRGENGYYGAWRIDGIGVTNFPPYQGGRLSGVWYFQTNGGPYFDSGIRAFDLTGNPRPAETGYDMGAFEYAPDKTPPSGSIAISAGDRCTRSVNVLLNLSASDSSGVAQMQFSNEDGSWSEPEAYSSTKTWVLSPEYGSKTVYVKFKDNLDNWSDAISDTIAYPEPGDFDNSGEVDLADVVVLLQITAGMTGGDQPGLLCADLTGDDHIDLSDAVHILHILP